MYEPSLASFSIVCYNICLGYRRIEKYLYIFDIKIHTNILLRSILNVRFATVHESYHSL